MHTAAVQPTSAFQTFLSPAQSVEEPGEACAQVCRMTPKYVNAKAGRREEPLQQDLLLSTHYLLFSAVAQATKEVEGGLSHFFASWLGLHM